LDVIEKRPKFASRDRDSLAAVQFLDAFLDLFPELRPSALHFALSI
jgi:hypothetical protein